MPRLRDILEDYYEQYHRPEFLPGDPLQFAHRFTHQDDQEVAALVAAAFASGNVKAINAVLERLFAVLGPRPADWLRNRRPEQIQGTCSGIQHRWVRAEDLELLLALLAAALQRWGTLGALWQEVDDPRRPDTWDTLADFVEAIHALPAEPLVPRARSLQRANGKISPLASVETILLTSPRRGSACKRMHLFLRWMARPADGIDLGLWTRFLHPDRLVVPVDVHVLRQAQALGLTKRPAPDPRTASEITGRLRRINREDPTKYDFALVRVGIEELKQARRRPKGA